MWKGPNVYTGKTGIVHARYDVICKLGVKSNLTFDFLITISYPVCNFYKVTMKDKGRFLLTPILNSIHNRPMQDF